MRQAVTVLVFKPGRDLGTSLTLTPDADYTPRWSEGSVRVPGRIVKTRFRRISPSVETGPSTSGVGRAYSLFPAEISLVRPALER